MGALLVRVGHLARRFFGSLWPVGPSGADEEWVASVLTDRQLAWWRRMSGVDRRHAVAVAHRVERTLGHEATPAVLAAALLHDVGKVASGLGTYGRVVATVAGAAAGQSMAQVWSERRGFTRKVGLYLRHAELGGDMLAMASSDALTVTWAREHHSPATEWTIDNHIAAALKAADDD